MPLFSITLLLPFGYVAAESYYLTYDFINFFFVSRPCPTLHRNASISACTVKWLSKPKVDIRSAP